uniref:Uncharacterized protein n=1 Tax=Siphoviridae sp. ctDmQ3 TaxID=2823570 RepID=A0A8S5L824_9CAUD|nr:MAG TPA: hypothetical protein [Siphoviridae sp. ctDmQ3]
MILSIEKVDTYIFKYSCYRCIIYSSKSERETVL